MVGVVAWPEPRYSPYLVASGAALDFNFIVKSPQITSLLFSKRQRSKSGRIEVQFRLGRGFRPRVGHFLEQVRAVIAHAVDPTRDGPKVDDAGRRRTCEACHVGFGALPEPGCPVFLFQYHGHAVVQPCHVIVGSGGQDGEGLQGFADGIAPALPDARERQRTAVRPGDRVRLLAVRKRLPLLEGVGDYKGAPRLQGRPEHAGCPGGFRPCVDRPLGRLQILGERRHKSPS